MKVRNIFTNYIEIELAIIKHIEPIDVIPVDGAEEVRPLYFYNSFSGTLSPFIVDVIRDYVEESFSRMFTPVTKNGNTVYFIKDEDLSYVIDLAQCFIIKGVIDPKYRVVWALLTSIPPTVIGNEEVEIPIESITKKGLLSKDEVLRALGEAINSIENKALSLQEIVEVPDTEKVRIKDINRLRYKIHYYAYEAWKELKFVRPLLTLLCMEGPLPPAEVKEKLSKWLRYRQDSIRTRILSPAKNKGYIRIITTPSGEEIIVPNCKQCIFYANEKQCREDALKILRKVGIDTSNLINMPTCIINTLKNYIQFIINEESKLRAVLKYLRSIVYEFLDRETRNFIASYTVSILQKLIIEASKEIGE
jgi:hypothetical protein